MRHIQLPLICVFLAACSTPPAPSISGSWQPLNGYTRSVREIPLSRPYYFQSLPIDVTVKSLLSRWAKESNMAITYEHPSDFTLQTDVARIQQSRLTDALQEINAIYEANHLTAQIVPNRGLVVSYLQSGSNDIPAVEKTVAAPLERTKSRYATKHIVLPTITAPQIQAPQPSLAEPELASNAISVNSQAATAASEINPLTPFVAPTENSVRTSKPSATPAAAPTPVNPLAPFVSKY